MLEYSFLLKHLAEDHLCVGIECTRLLRDSSRWIVNLFVFCQDVCLSTYLLFAFLMSCLLKLNPSMLGDLGEACAKI